MKVSKVATLVYALLCNIPVSFCLCFASNLSANNGSIDWPNLLFNYSISLPIAILITFVVPLVPLGKKLTASLGVDNETFTHNLLYRLIATFLYACIYFIILNPILTLINIWMNHAWMPVTTFLFQWIRGIPFMVIVGFVSSLVFDFPAFRVAHKIDPNF